MINFSKTTSLYIICVVLLFIAGVFAYQWRQTKGKLIKQTEQNRSLVKQVEELQKEIKKLKNAKGGATDRTAEWKTYRNEEYGFEIDYPMVDWGFDRESLCRTSLPGLQKDEPFCIYIKVESFSSDCFGNDWNWVEVAANMYDCSFEEMDVSLGREVTTNSGIKGYRIKRGMAHAELIGGAVFVLRTKRADFPIQEVLLMDYSMMEGVGCTQEDLNIFDQIVSTFKYIE